MIWLYGMKTRPVGPGCQPKTGFAFVAEKELKEKIDELGIFWDVIAYSRELTQEEIFKFELYYITTAEKEES